MAVSMGSSGDDGAYKLLKQTFENKAIVHDKYFACTDGEYAEKKYEKRLDEFIEEVKKVN